MLIVQTAGNHHRLIWFYFGLALLPANHASILTLYALFLQNTALDLTAILV